MYTQLHNYSKSYDSKNHYSKSNPRGPSNGGVELSAGLTGRRSAGAVRAAVLVGLAVSAACAAALAEKVSSPEPSSIGQDVQSVHSTVDPPLAPARVATATMAAMPATGKTYTPTVRKEAKVGMLTGVATGAAVGGPIGAAVGLFIGGILGDSAGMAKESERHSKILEADLTEARTALFKVTAEADNDAVMAGLAERLRAHVLFKTGSAELQSDVALRLEQVGAILATHPTLCVQLHGFADPRGSAQYNEKLSQERVAVVRDALIRGGTAERQIQDSAHGADLSTATRGDLDAYAWERRVSVSIVSVPPTQSVAATN